MPESFIITGITLIAIGWVLSLVVGGKWTGVLVLILAFMYCSYKIGTMVIM